VMGIQGKFHSRLCILFEGLFPKSMHLKYIILATQKYCIFCVAGNSQYISDDTFIIVQFRLWLIVLYSCSIPVSMAVSLRTSVTPITTGPAGIYHFTTQIVFELFIVGIGITIQHLYPRLESTAFLIYSGAPRIGPLIYIIRQNQG